jgi:hypothetical protein
VHPQKSQINPAGLVAARAESMPPLSADEASEIFEDLFPVGGLDVGIMALEDPQQVFQLFGKRSFR